MSGPALMYHGIDPMVDADLAFGSYRDACVASFGSDHTCMSQTNYLAWLTRRIDEFPDGHVIATIGDRFVGQLELQIPYGLHAGYVNLFYVARPWRRLGLGRRLHEYAENYFRSWEATTIELDVSPLNKPAVQFYRSLGYRTIASESGSNGMWKMSLGVAKSKKSNGETRLTRPRPG